jgi:uncharacterized membrane protein YdjX (TVP38/TMEM64 family)
LFQYCAATVLGMGPGLLATSVFGAQISAALEDFSTVNYWIVGAAVLLLAVAAWVAARWLKRNTPHPRA